MKLTKVDVNCLQRRDQFSIGGLTWVVLGQNEIGDTLTITLEPTTYSKLVQKLGDSWQDSPVREYLNGIFLRKLQHNGLNLDDIVNIKDAINILHYPEYLGGYTDKVFLLTFIMYRNYLFGTPPLPLDWWLNGIDTNGSALYVDRQGKIRKTDFPHERHLYGVRPALYLRAGTKVEKL